MAALALLASAGMASASIVSIGEFTGDYQEGFETQPRFQFLPHYDVFGGMGDVNQVGGGQGLHITTGWAFFQTIFPHGGDVFMGGAGVNAEWVFDVPAKRFGGYFGTNADVPDAMAYFYDEAGNLIDSLAVGAPLGSWKWNGWETTGAGIKRVEIIANNQYNGFIMHDDMEYTMIPAPGGLALLGLGSLALRRRR
jgi:hypothetical protein